METSKQGFVSVPAPGSSATAQGEDGMHEMQAPLPAMYLQTLGRLPLYPQMAHPGRPTSQDAVAFPLSISPLPTKQALPLLTFHITSGTQLQQQGQRSGVAAPPARPKSAGKHVCPHCGRDCLKPSVLEKHLRCHTGERPYPCTICGIAFKTQSNLYKHKRTQAHARLSSESEKGSFSSQESIPGSGDTCSSSPSLGAQSEDLESFEREVSAPPVTPCTTSISTQPPAAQGKIGSDTGWALHQAALVGLILAPVNGNQEKLNSIVQKAGPSVGLGTAPAAKPPTAEGEQKPPPAALTPNRHLLLQRQEATFFSKQWESSTSRGKSQSHDSTDSGFSEGNEQHWTSSPGGTLHDHSMESLTESSMEQQEDLGPPDNPSEPAAAGAKSRVSVLEKRKLEERISKLISENETLVDDKRLENVRPRKTVLSKQGSIDLPMPYTYKDSFHFEMRTSKQTSMAFSQQSPDRRVKQALYNSVPTQQSTSLDHMPLTRSSSLPFCLSSLERSSQHGHYHREGGSLARRESSGQLYSGEFVIKSVDQQSSHHRSLVRQSAVDCLPTGLNVTSSVEESYPSSLASDGDSIDAVGEAGGGKCRRKKAQKFSYNKWHMYGGGTFTKLYNTDKGSDHGSLRTKKAVVSAEQGRVHEIQSRSSASLPEPIASVMSTAGLASAATSIQTTCRSQCLPNSLTSTCCSQPSQGHSGHVSSGPHLQRPSSDLSSSTHHCVVRQGSLPAPDCTNSSRAVFARGIIQKEQNTQHNPTSQCLSHLPSERKKQRTEDGTGMPVDIIDQEEKRHNVLTCMTCKAGDSNLVRPNQPSVAFCSSTTSKYTHPTNRGDSSKLQFQHQGSRMDLNLRFISQHLNQRSLQNKGHDSLPSLVSVGRLTASPTVSATLSMSALTKSSFLPKYQLKLPHSAISEQNFSAVPALEQRLMTIPASEQSLSIIPTSEQEKSLTPIPAIDREKSLPPIPTPTSAQCLFALPTPSSEHSLPDIPTPTSEHSLLAMPTPTSEQCLTSAPTIAPKTSAKPKPALKQNRSPTPNPSSTLTPTTTSTSSETCAASPTTAFGLSPAAPTTSGHTHTAQPTLTSGQSHNATPTPTPETSHSAASTSGSMHTASPHHRATCAAAMKLSDTATPSTLCASQNTLFPTAESLPAGKVILLKGVSHAPSEETDYVKTGDIQIILQIISDDQLSLMEAELSTQGSQPEAGVCQAVPRAATENAEAGIPQSVSRQPNIPHCTQLLAASAQGRSATDMAQASPTCQVSSAQLSGPSAPSNWEIFPHTKQHQEYQSCERSAQNNSSLLKSSHILPQDLMNPPVSTDNGDWDRTPSSPGHEAGGSELRATEGQFACVHTEPQMHDQCRPGNNGFPPLTRNPECPNQELSKEVPVNSMGEARLPQQRVRADTADCPVLVYSQAPPSSMASSTATVDRNAYPRLYIPELRSALADTHTKTEKQSLTGTEKTGSLTFLCAAGADQQNQKLPMEVPLAAEKNAVNAAAGLRLEMDCRDPLTSQGPKNKMFSAHKHHFSPPNSLHVWDVARCPDGHFSSDPRHCQNATPSSAPSMEMERPTATESVGGGDTSSTSHLSPASNHLFTRPHSETAHPTAVSQHSTQTSTCEGPSLFQGSKTQFPAVRQCATDMDDETFQDVQGHDSLLTDLRQRGTDTVLSPLTLRPGLQDPVQTYLPGVTQELPQQVTSEHATADSVPPEPTPQHQAQNERHSLEASVHNSSTEPCLQAFHPADQQEPFSASLPGQPKLCLAAGISLSPSAAAEISSGNVLLHGSVQHKPLNQRVSCNTGKQRTKCGIIANDVVNPTETSGGLCKVQPACLIGRSGVEQAGLGAAGQSTEASSPSFLFSRLDRTCPLSQDPVPGTGTSTKVLQTEKSQLALKPSDTLCGHSGRALSGGSLSISSVMSSQMLVSSNEPQEEQGQEDMASDSFASPPRSAPKERRKDGAQICASADTRKDSQNVDAAHLSSRSAAAPAGQEQEQETQDSSQSLEQREDRVTEDRGSRQPETMERGGVGETDGVETGKRGWTDPCTSPSSEPHKEATAEDNVKDSLDDNGPLSNRETSVSPPFPQTPSQREASAVHTFISHRDSRCHGAGQGQQKEYSDVKSCSTEQVAFRGPCPPLSAAQRSHTPAEACPLPVNAGPSGCGTTAQAVSHSVTTSATSPLQSASLSAGSRAQPEGPRATGQTGARPEQAAPAAARAHPAVSPNSAAPCSSPPVSLRPSEAAARAAHSSQEEADASSSDDEGRLVIELE